MPRRRLGNKPVLTLDGTDIACLLNFTPPERSREEVDVTCLEDDAEEYLDADPPNEGILKFEAAWEPGDTNSELLDALFDEVDPDDREGAFTIKWSMFTPLVTDAFSGRILKLSPAQVEKKTLIKRSVEIRLTTKVTRTVAT
ncbi:phage tail tube protein [Aureliella helgolandensis]|uniref:Lambda phage tail tube protein N-terminal domain-containing protein n=1 Tax=Aureliella helgolandensis TaxID=2527968 RepID=A0A518GDS3_9BACT|nr:phage tail tube protein [Aureliella helgolandensis]QDV26743.1 hypothetical protein Q31a_51220 [Aureliella helgolandensis]